MQVRLLAHLSGGKGHLGATKKTDGPGGGKVQRRGTRREKLSKTLGKKSKGERTRGEATFTKKSLKKAASVVKKKNNRKEITRRKKKTGPCGQFNEKKKKKGGRRSRHGKFPG